MCGIVGLVQFDGLPLTQELLWRMTKTLLHRGPEDQGVRLAASGHRQVGFGHTRLKIIDLSNAAGQPMSNEDGSVWITFNGEIYNYRELRQSLAAQGMRFRTSSDTEVILRLYEREGTRCVELLDGMYALGIWDGRHECLLLARDRLGKKPLFYYSTPAVFAFASEIKALLRHPQIAPAVNTQALPAFFLHGYVPTPSTLYQGIQKLPPGHLLCVDREGSMRIEEYWDIPRSSMPERPAQSRAQATTAVRQLVTEAVRRRLIADVPMGAFLSGGLDSSIVVGLMSQLTREPVRTFSIGFAGDAHFNETHYAQVVSRHFKTLHTEFIVEPSAFHLIEELVWHHDGPFGDSSAIPTYLLSRLTKEHVTVALTGDGGDELFGGYLRFYAALLSERVPRWVWRVAGRSLTSLPEWGGHRGLFRRLQKFAGGAALPFIERYSRWIAVFYDDLDHLLPGQRGEQFIAESLGHLEPYLRRCECASQLTTLLYLNIKTYLLDDLLVKMDRCSMAHALEVRSPFLDRALLEYVFALPDATKLRWGRTKVILRQAFADLLPPAILQRGKMGFGVPLRVWFTTELREYLQDLLLAPDARLRGYVEQDYIRQLWQAHQAGWADHSHRLWTLLTFEVWLRQLALHPGSLSAHPSASPLRCLTRQRDG